MNHLFAHVEIKGSLTFSQEMLLEGKVEGDVSSTGPLIVGNHAFIKGKVTTRSVVVHGHVEGNISVKERCELKSTATVIGNITAAFLIIQEGAVFCGRSQVRRPAVSSEKSPTLFLKA